MIAKQGKNRRWTEKETETLQRFARYTPEVVARKMRERGYNRTVTACSIKMKKMYMEAFL